MYQNSFKEKHQFKILKNHPRPQLPINFFFDSKNGTFWCYKNSNDFLGACCWFQKIRPKSGTKSKKLAFLGAIFFFSNLDHPCNCILCVTITYILRIYKHFHGYFMLIPEIWIGKSKIVNFCKNPVSWLKFEWAVSRKIFKLGPKYFTVLFWVLMTPT